MVVTAPGLPGGEGLVEGVGKIKHWKKSGKKGEREETVFKHM